MGLYAQVGYLFPATGNDITLGYTYLRSNEKDSVVKPTGGSIFTPPLSDVGLQQQVSLDSASGKAEFDLDAVDLEMGQRFTTGAYDMRMFAGLRYASINHTLTSNALSLANSQAETPAAVYSQEFTSNYKGIGPRIGVDSRYCLQSGFGLDANFSTALLVGNVDGKYNAVSAIAAATPTTSGFQAKNGSSTRVVPVLEAKLGLDYTHIMDRCSKSSLVFEAGYQVTNYFNAVDHARVVSASNYVATQNTTTDVSFDGPYLGVKYYA